MSVTATSRAAYHSHRADITQKQKIMNALAEHGPLCDRELAELTGVPTHLVPARRGELLKAEVIKLHNIERRGMNKLEVEVWELNI
jgi:predicted transcriptional regulator